VDGLLIIDKPVGPTSHDVVARMRQALRERRVGHTGTLDPAASGVLALVLGRATRLAQFLSTGDKTYDATVRLGFATDTYDALGHQAGAIHAGPFPTREIVDRALDAFRGTFQQRPPAFSAKMIDGRRSYKIARAARREGRDVSSAGAASAPAAVEAPAATVPAPATVATRVIDVLGVDLDRVRLRVVCSAGFYVRSLAHDLGEQLGTGGHLEALRRTHNGDATLEHAVDLAAIERNPGAALKALVPLNQMLPSLAPIVLTERGVRRARNGCELGPGDTARGVVFDTLTRDSARAEPRTVRLMNPDGELVGIGAPARTRGLLHPAVILM